MWAALYKTWTKEKTVADTFPADHYMYPSVFALARELFVLGYSTALGFFLGYL